MRGFLAVGGQMSVHIEPLGISDGRARDLFAVLPLTIDTDTSRHVVLYHGEPFSRHDDRPQKVFVREGRLASPPQRRLAQQQEDLSPGRLLERHGPPSGLSQQNEYPATTA